MGCLGRFAEITEGVVIVLGGGRKRRITLTRERESANAISEST